MPLLRITCPSGHTERIVELLHAGGHATELSVVPRASRVSGGDLILAEVSRSSVDELLEHLPGPTSATELHVSIDASEQLFPRDEHVEADDDAVIWAQVDQDVHEVGRLSWINLLLVVIAAMIAAVGILEDQLLLIVGAMALSPDYFPVADTCLSIVNRSWSRVRSGLLTLAAIFTAGAIGAWLFTELGVTLGVVSESLVPGRGLTQFISRPDAMTVLVALLAGAAGALAITLPDARGLVGVFVSITTIPAAANIGVALADRDWTEMRGAAVQLAANVVSLVLAGTLTLELRHRVRRWR